MPSAMTARPGSQHAQSLMSMQETIDIIHESRSEIEGKVQRSPAAAHRQHSHLRGFKQTVSPYLHNYSYHANKSE
jgi:hypothetical protein